MVSTMVIGLSASALFLAVETTIDSQNDALEQTIAMGMARQLIDEVLGQPYHGPGESPTEYPLGMEYMPEDETVVRAWFDDTGDYDGYASSQAVDMWGIPLGAGNGNGGVRVPALRVPGEFFSKFLQQVEVYYVADDDPSQRLAAGETSYHRAVEVTIRRVNGDGSTTELVRLRQVFAYVPPPS